MFQTETLGTVLQTGRARPFSHLLLVLMDETFVPRYLPPQVSLMLRLPERQEAKLHANWRKAPRSYRRHTKAHCAPSESPCTQPASPRPPRFPSLILCREEAGAWVLSNRTEDCG